MLTGISFILVATTKALKMQGGVAKENLLEENVDAVRKGCKNLGRHIRNIGQYGVPVTVAINEFQSDTVAEFIVVVCGDIMTMPGLPRKPSSENISVDENKKIVGLF